MWVKAACVNFANVLIRIGLYPESLRLPAVIGYEISGVVDVVGANVPDVADGARVLALLPDYSATARRRSFGRTKQWLSPRT